MTDFVKLREIAEKATPGPWHHCSDGRPELSNIAQYVEDLDGALIAYDQMTEADAAFIAAFNPQVALSLLADRARMEKDIEAQRDTIDGLDSDLFAAVAVAYRRGAVEWVRLNYPKWLKRLSSTPSLGASQ